MSSTQPLPASILGVFGYLEAALPEATLDALSKEDIELGIRPKTWNSPRARLCDLVENEFRLMYGGSPLREVLASYRLYYRGDMADALVCAFSLHRRKMDPNAALNADYSLKWGGVLQWITIEEIKKADARGHSLWSVLRRFHEEDDRFVRYRLPTLMGVILVRGDRLVLKVEELHMCVIDGDPHWEAERAEFVRLGGNAAFLAGKFDWPPSGWVNPMTAAAADEERGRRRRLGTGTDEIDPGSPAAMKFVETEPNEISEADQQALASIGNLLGGTLTPMKLK